MNQKDLINTISNNTSESKAAVERILSNLSIVIADELKTTGSITVHGVGTIVAVNAAAREGRNPATGEVIHIPAKKRIKIKACKALKDAIAI